MYFKEFYILSAIVFVAVTADKKITVKVSPELVLKLRTISKDCGEKTGVDPGILPKVIDWTFDVDEPTKEYIYCLTVNAGYVARDGSISVPKMLQLEVLEGTKEELASKLKECNKIKEERKIDTVFEIGRCTKKFLVITAIKPST